mmetsp:Transcript_21066/g.51707  ORF Transcript_21066/g.51707 Transcript_21066/m.51707 type:complete len:1563 (-) Transcript_21066:460-5148(-)
MADAPPPPAMPFENAISTGHNHRVAVTAQQLNAIKPGAQGEQTALGLIVGVMMSLAEVFGFQHQSVQNQAEHIAALWRSKMGAAPSRAAALSVLHNDLLFSYKHWLGAVQNAFPPAQAPVVGIDAVAQQLDEVCLYLCIWGEAGNVRFMPELLLFVFEAARQYYLEARRSPIAIDPYTSVRGDDEGRDGAEGPNPGDFLVFIIRPIYNKIFGETFTWNSNTHKPVFKFPGAAPKHVLNYDDINEIFWDTRLMKKALLVGDKPGQPLLEAVGASDRPQLFPWLCEVRWNLVTSRNAKMYWETHSWFPLFASFGRVYVLHFIAFAACLAYRGHLAWAFVGLPAPACSVVIELAAYLLCKQHTYAEFFWTTSSTLVMVGLPVATFVQAARETDFFEASKVDHLDPLMLAHYIASGLSALFFLVSTISPQTGFRPMIRRSVLHLISSFLFWAGVFAIKCSMSIFVLLPATTRATDGVPEVKFAGPTWQIVNHVVLWMPVGLSFITETAFYQTLLIGTIGPVLAAFRFGFRTLCGAYRRGKGMDRIPRNLITTLVKPDAGDEEIRSGFGHIWHEIIEDLCLADLLKGKNRAKLDTPESLPGAGVTARLPSLFDPAVKRKPLPKIRSDEARRRLVMLARAWKQNPPAARDVRSCPSLTVMIPHYAEDNLITMHQLFHQKIELEKGATVLMAYLVDYFGDEFINFATRLHSSNEPVCDEQVQFELRRWASLRMQTLWRTVEGMAKGHRAMDVLLQLQVPYLTDRARDSICRDKFQCLVAMQLYGELKLGSPELEAAEEMLQRVPSSTAIAFLVNDQDRKEHMEAENIKQTKRFYSCVVDSSCAFENGRRVPKYVVELPGFPVLGNGKSDNQNHAIIFSRGELIQAIDANQESYLESAILLPSVLAEFAPYKGQQGGRSRPGIVGFREHIFSAVGALGSLAAEGEFVFGTVTQRMLTQVLACRMHYGHPDIMDKLQMLTQGGISKATRGLNLSEDIFAGMDLTLRGGEIKYTEYHHVGKGRDMGFMSILSFFGKLAAGTAEQSITRQSFRLGRGLSVPRLLGYYYSHVGYYFNQILMAKTVWWFVFAMTFFGLSDATGVGAEQDSSFRDGASKMYSGYFGPVFFLFVLATMWPLIFEFLVEDGIVKALRTVVLDLLALSPMFYTFQGKIIAHYMKVEIVYGGAEYIPTGRGLATVRQSFRSLFASFANTNMFDGFELLSFILASYLVGSSSVDVGYPYWFCIGTVVSSWLVAPFLYNPYMFSLRAVYTDALEFGRWLVGGIAKEGTPANKITQWSWLEWTTSLQTPRQRASRHWLYLPSWRLLTAVLSECLTATVVTSDAYEAELSTTADQVRHQVLPLLPPIFAGLALGLVAIFHGVVSCCLKERVHPTFLLVVCAVFVAFASMAEVYAMVRWPVWDTDYGFHTGVLIVFNKYCVLRWELDWADWLMPKYSECFAGSQGIIATGVAFWAVAWRWCRDALLGTLVTGMIAVISLFLSIPGVAQVHHRFLFRNRAKVTGKGNNPDQATQLPKFLRKLAQDKSLSGFEQAAVKWLQSVVEHSLHGGGVAVAQ